jgi:crossover junction endodeoxyribonuclease RusA
LSVAITLTSDTLPTSANRLWTIAGRKMIPTREYAMWKSATGLLWKSQAHGLVIDGPYALRMYARKPDKRRRDVDNLLKAASDTIVYAGLVSDDSHCERVSAEWTSETLKDDAALLIHIISTTGAL